MPSFDFFEHTGLNYDPPEKSPKKVKNAISKLETELTGKGGTAVRQLDELRELKKKLLTADGKLSPGFAKLAEEKTRLVQAELGQKIKAMKTQEIERFVPELTIRAQATARKLTADHVRAVYVANGFEVDTENPQSYMPTFPNNIRQIEAWLDSFQKAEDRRTQSLDRSGVTDLYAFVAYLDKVPGQADAYRRKSSRELLARLEAYLNENPFKGGDQLRDLCIDLANAAKVHVFETEEKRRSYDRYLLLHTPEMQKVLEDIKNATPDQRNRPEFFEPRIGRIKVVFGDWREARAIYNDKAQTQIIKEEGKFRIRCAYCKTLTECNSATEAKQSRCKCGRLFFRKCPGCSKQVQSIDLQCPHCGRTFLSPAEFDLLLRGAGSALQKEDLVTAKRKLDEAENGDPARKAETGALRKTLQEKEKIIAETKFRESCRQAQEFLERGDLDAATKVLGQLDQQFPNKKNETDNLRKQVETLRQRYGVPLNNISNFIKNKRFFSAEKYILSDVKKKYPMLDISRQQRMINAVLAECKTQFNQVAPNAEAKAEACLNILQRCVDYPPALEYLKSTPLTPPPNLTAVTTPDVAQIDLYWGKTLQKGVKYRLVRSLQNGTEQVVLAEETENQQFCDKTVRAGVTYVYSVSAVRVGAISSAKTTSARLLLRVSALKATQNPEGVALHWNTPDGAIGAEILRICNGNRTLIAERATSPFQDTGLSINEQYQYCVTALYPGNGRSLVKTVSVKITPDIGSFKLNRKVDDTTITVMWSIPYPDIRILILDANRPGTNEPGKPETRYHLLAEAVSQDGKVTIKRHKNQTQQIGALAFSAGKWIPSENGFLVNNFTPFVFGTTEVAETDDQKNMAFTIHGTIPKDPALKALRVFTKTKKNESDPIPWVKSGFDSDEDCRVFPLNDPHNQTDHWNFFLPQGETDTYYLTAVLEYSNGQFSPPANRVVRCLRKIDVSWKVKKHIFSESELELTLSSNHSFNSHAQFMLCASKDNRAVTRPDANNSICVVNIASQTFTPCKSRTVSASLQNKQEFKGKKLYLFVCGVQPFENYRLYWSKGFKGTFP